MFKYCPVLWQHKDVHIPLLTIILGMRLISHRLLCVSDVRMKWFCGIFKIFHFHRIVSYSSCIWRAQIYLFVWWKKRCKRLLLFLFIRHVVVITWKTEINLIEIVAAAGNNSFCVTKRWENCRQKSLQSAIIVTQNKLFPSKYFVIVPPPYLI